MKRREWLAQVQKEVDDNEDVIVAWYEVLVTLWQQGESPRRAAEWVLALEGD